VKPVGSRAARLAWSWGPVVVWMAATFAASHRSAIAIPFGAPDYVAHALGYAVLGALFVRALGGGPLGSMTRSLIVPATLIGALYGASDEFHQWFIPGRMASAGDLVADAIGSLAGAAAAATTGAFVRRMRWRV
jgi:VanZ family protein